MIRNLPLCIVVAVAFSCALLFGFATPCVAQEADAPALYFADPKRPVERVPIADEPIELKAGSLVNLTLLLRLPSPAAQRDFVRLVVDDYRHDEPNYFQDKRVPNIVFEITSPDGKPALFGASSQGGGKSGAEMSAYVTLYLGVDPEKINAEMKRLMAEGRAQPNLTREEGMKMATKLLELDQELRKNRPGTYHVRAHYRPKVAGKWIGEVSTKPITIKIVGG